MGATGDLSHAGERDGGMHVSCPQHIEVAVDSLQHEIGQEASRGPFQLGFLCICCDTDLATLSTC